MKPQTQIKIIFALRICLWIVALFATVWWMYYSVKLHIDGIYDVHEYATALRPILYGCVAVAIAAVAISFGLHVLSVKIKNKDKTDRDQSLAERINR